MALQDTVIPVDFGAGLDSKTDPKKVVAGKFLMVQNGVYTSLSRVQKRNGYSALPAAIAGGGSLISPTLLKSYNSELLTADQGQLFSYSPSQSRWAPRGNYTSVDLARTSVDQEHPCSGYADTAIAGNYAVYCWTTVTNGSVLSSTYGSVVDLQTGTVVLGPVLLATANSTGAVYAPRCVALAGSTLAVIYVGSSNHLVIRTLSTTAGAIAFSAETTLTTLNTVYTAFDVVQTSTGAAVAGITPTGTYVATLSSSGAVTHSTTTTDSQAIYPIHIALNSGDNTLWVYYLRFTGTAGNIMYSVYSSTLTSVLAPTVGPSTASPYYVTNMAAVTTGSTQQTLYYGYYTSAGATIDATSQATFNEAGAVGTPTLTANGVMPYSRIFQAPTSSATHNYAVFVYRGATNGHLSGNYVGLQTTYFLVDLTASTTGSPCVVGRFASAAAFSQATLGVGSTGVIATTPNVPVVGSTAYLACGVATQSFQSDSNFTSQWSTRSLTGIFSYSFNFQSPNAYSASKAGPCLILSGACPSHYDGQNCTEWGFHLFPEITVTGTGTTGLMGAGTYSYIAIFQWTDAQGNLHQSAPSSAVSATVSANGSVNLSVSAAYLSNKPGVTVAIYRTTNGGSIYYLVTDPVFLLSASATTATTVSYGDGMSDSTLIGDPQAYSYPGSAVLNNSAPAPFTLAAAHNNRLWFISSEDGTLWYTKTIQAAVGLSPTFLLTAQIDAKGGGSTTALAEMDDKLVGWKGQTLYYMAGDGGSDTGAGGNLSAPTFIPAAVGCTAPKSVVLTPKGLIFQSQSGLYLLDRSLGVHYADSFFTGAAVEAFNSQTYTDARIVPNTSQIRILTSSGFTIVYDYLFDKWGTFTNHAGYSSDIWNGSYVYLRTDGTIYQESASTFLDNGTAYSLRAQTSWLALSSVQNFQRVKILELLGDYAGGSGHGVQVSLAYDFSSSFSSPVAYSFTGSSGPFQYRQFPAQQKCDAISLLIEEVTTGASGEYIDLTNLSMQAGLKKGVNKLSAGSSVG